jgi:hypothetical protein
MRARLSGELAEESGMTFFYLFHLAPVLDRDFFYVRLNKLYVLYEFENVFLKQLD